MRLVRMAAAAGAILLLFSGSASAQATRTWVSGVGDDANPCSRTAPCKTFAGAISKTANGGEIDALDPGGFGSVTITKSITIDGGGGQVASILSSGVQGIVINALASDNITIRNIGINGAGTTLGTQGITILGGGAVHVENCTIFNYSGNGINMVTTDLTVLTVRDTIFKNCAQNGILVKSGVGGTSLVQVDHSRFDHNGNGVQVQDIAVVTISDSVATGNNLNGFLANSVGAGGQLNLVRCTSSNNLQDGIKSAGGTSIVRVTDNIVSNNFGIGLHSTGGALLSAGNNFVMGNFGGDGGGTSLMGPS